MSKFDKPESKKPKSFYSWDEKVAYYNEKAMRYINHGNEGLLFGYKNTQKAFAALIPLEEALYERRKSSREPSTINLAKKDYESLLFWVFYIEKGARRIHYVERIQRITNIPIKNILQRAKELERLREKRKVNQKFKEEEGE